MKFMNCTQHPLTSTQRERAIEKYGVREFAEFRDLAPDLYARLAQVEPSEDLESLADDFCDWLQDQASAGAKVAHLPIGSPGFMFVLGDVLSSRRRENYNAFPLIVFFALPARKQG